MRELVAAKDFTSALRVVETRLAQAPEDAEARVWRARLLAWSGHLSAAEAEYRRVLQSYPHDVDVLLGLADVLAWQQRHDEALALLDQARQRAPQRVDLYTRRGRSLRALSRLAEARAAFRDALLLDATNTDAREALVALEAPPRHELRVEADFDRFPFAQDAQSVTTAVLSRWNKLWSTRAGGNFQHRFGQRVGQFVGHVSWHPSPRAALTIGGAAGSHEGVIAKSSAFFEYSHGFRLSTRGIVRSLELGSRQQWLWFRDARILAFTPTVLAYLPRDWLWSLSLTVARSRFPGTPAEWRPSGRTRLYFPLGSRLGGNVFFAVGTENFAQADQIGRFSARNFGGGLRWRVTRRQELSGYAFYQDRSQDRTQFGFGFSYAVRF